MMKFIWPMMILMLLVACQPYEKPQPPTIESSDWMLVPEQSTFSFVTTKNKVVKEQNSIQYKSGTIKNLTMDVVLDLNSVDTLIPIRDQRLRDILFETKTYPTAHIHKHLPEKWPLDQPFGIPFVLNLHGHQQTLATEVIVQVVNDQLVVVNYEPIMVNAKDFTLDDAINKLTKIAGLQSINYEVLVDFKLTFEKSGI